MWVRAVPALRASGTLLVVAVLLGAFSLSSERFLAPENLLNILKQISIVAILGIGMTMVILIGGIDLSAGSVVLLSGVVMASLIYNRILPALPAIAAALAAGMAVGLLNGILIERVRISPVIVTLGTMVAVRGLGQMVLWINNSWLWVTDALVVAIAEQDALGLPFPAVIMFVLYLLAAAVMHRTGLGRYIYAIGNNQRAAELSGVPVLRVKVWVYVISGLCAGIGGVLVAARMGVMSPVVGTGMEFDAITAVLLGGTSLSGGVGRVEKTILGAIIVGLISNYLTIRGISAHYQAAVLGLVILAAVMLDRLIQGRREA